MGRWSSNFLRNWEVFPDLRPLGELRGKFSGIPGVIAAAGPSLENSLDQIRNHRSSLILIAVDTAYGRLRDEGLNPDFLVSTDAQYWNSRHLDRLSAPLPFLVGEMTSAPNLWRNRGGTGLLGNSAVPLYRDLGTLWGRDLGNLPSGGSVATTAWSTAALLGLSPVVFAGLDLAYPREENHIRGSTFEELPHNRSTRFLPAQTVLSRQGDAAARLVRPNWQGGSVNTDVRMDLYRRWFETQVDPTGEDLPWILMPQGQRIRGFRPLETLDQIFSRIPCPPELGRKARRIVLDIPPLGEAHQAKTYLRVLASGGGKDSLFQESWAACRKQFGSAAEQEWDREIHQLLTSWKP